MVRLLGLKGQNFIILHDKLISTLLKEFASLSSVLLCPTSFLRAMLILKVDILTRFFDSLEKHL